MRGNAKGGGQDTPHLRALHSVRESHLPHRQEHKLALRVNTDLVSY